MEIKSLDDFKKSLQDHSPSEKLSVYARALWWAGKGNWDNAHDLIQDVNDKKASQIHAYLHRVEGDISNANYWYMKAGTQPPDCSLEEEWEVLSKKHM
jgi:neutral trehalase